MKASVEAVAAAIRETPLDDARLARTLMAVRTFGRSLQRDPVPIPSSATASPASCHRRVGERDSARVRGPAVAARRIVQLDAAEWRDLVPK